jgi:triosephosphate isomerase
MRTDLRRPLAAANWKMHLGREAALAWCRAVGAELATAQTAAEVAVFPSFPLLPPVVAALANTPIEVGGQDLHAEEKGAHTGDVSGAQLADAGCRLVLCGHSERRRDHAESDELVGRKVAAAARLGLWPLLCVGETREERRRGETFAVLERQLRAGLASAPVRLIVAYEPVWAIGTGETATPELAEEAHAFLRGALAAVPPGIAPERVRLLYGGSVTPENAAELAAQPEIDGFLVGGASLDPGKFIDIIRVCGSFDGAPRSSPS